MNRKQSAREGEEGSSTPRYTKKNGDGRIDVGVYGTRGEERGVVCFSVIKGDWSPSHGQSSGSVRYWKKGELERRMKGKREKRFFFDKRKE